jgi:hypothetical protein
VGLSNFESWQANPDQIRLSLLLSCYASNLALVSYFLLKEVRQTYYNPRIRWWESKPRYTLRSPALITIKSGPTSAHGSTINCTLINLSEGGAFIHVPKGLTPHSRITLIYDCLGKEFQFSGEVLYQVQRQKNQYGIQFITPFKSKLQIKNLIRALVKLGIERRPDRTHWSVSLLKWLKQLFFEGKGLVPEIAFAFETPKGSMKRAGRHHSRSKKIAA